MTADLSTSVDDQFELPQRDWSQRQEEISATVLRVEQDPRQAIRRSAHGVMLGLPHLANV